MALSIRHLIGIIVSIVLLFRPSINAIYPQSFTLKALIRSSQYKSAFNFFIALETGLKGNIYKSIATELGFGLIGSGGTKIFI